MDWPLDRFQTLIGIGGVRGRERKAVEVEKLGRGAVYFLH